MIREKIIQNGNISGNAFGRPRCGHPKINAERLATHKALYGTSELPPRGTGLYHGIEIGQDTFSDYWQKIKDWWNGLDTVYKIAIGAGAGILILLLVLPKPKSELEKLMELKLKSEILSGK